MKKFEYTAVGNETGFTTPLLIGKRIVVAQKDGVGRADIITSGTATPKQVFYNSGNGNMDFGEVFQQREPALILYEDLVAACIPVSLSSVSLPDALTDNPYTVTFFANGTAPFSISAFSSPWLNQNVSGNQITLSGTPSVSDEGTSTVSFTLTNPCGSVPFSQSVNVSPNARTLTFSTVIHAGTFTYVSGTLNAPINVDLTLSSIFADGFPSVDCSGTGTSSVQAYDRLIGAGGLSNGATTAPTGDWSLANSFKIYNVVIDVAGGFNGVVFDGDVITMGLYDVTIIYDGC